MLGVLHHQALGDFEPQRARWHQIASENMTDFLDQILTEQLAARNIDADEQRIFAARQFALPPRGFACRHRKHVGAELHDQIAFLGDGDKLRRIEQPMLRMIPAHQRLETGELFRR